MVQLIVDIGYAKKMGHVLMPLLSQDFAVLKRIIKIEFEVRKNLRNVRKNLKNVKSRLLIL